MSRVESREPDPYFPVSFEGTRHDSHVVPLDMSQVELLAAVLSRALQDEPNFKYLMPDEQVRTVAIRACHFYGEIGEVPAETQIALLRVLQEHEFERVGGTQSIHTDARVIAATNRDLQVGISAGTFRSHLFYRLNVFPIEIPPLRERREDIPLLVEYFIDRYARKGGKNIKRISKTSMDLLQSYAWSGNIRELQNIIERSVILCETENFSVDESWLSRELVTTESKKQPELSLRLAAQEKTMIENALRQTGGRVSGPLGAAAKLGIPRSTLESKIRSLKIDKIRLRSKHSFENN